MLEYITSAGYSLTNISALHSISSDLINIFERAGSRGNSTMFLPSGVSEPVLSRAPSTHNWYIEFNMLSWKTNGHKCVVK